MSCAKKARVGKSRWSLRRQQLDDEAEWRDILSNVRGTKGTSAECIVDVNKEAPDANESVVVDTVAPDICSSWKNSVCTSNSQTRCEELPAADKTHCVLDDCSGGSDVEIDANNGCKEPPDAPKSYCVLEADDDFDGTDESDSDDRVEVCRAGRYNLDKELSLRDQLGRWCVHFRVSGTAFSVLLKILVIYGLAPDLPRDSRTVLKTARRVQTRQIPGGQYFHFGIAECLVPLLTAMKKSMFDGLEDVLNIIIGADGLPCFKSVNTHLWPILGSLRVNGINSRPFTIGLFYGVEKYNKVEHFLEDFVRDYNHCRNVGFSCLGRQFKVKVYAVIADAPGRAFLKNVMQYSSTAGCERCTVKGEKLFGMTFNDDAAKSRTNAGVAAGRYRKHCMKGLSPLRLCDIELVTNFVLDYMHLVLLGVLRRIISLWIESKKSKLTGHYRIKG